MSKYDALSAQLAPVLPVLPAEGIAYRGDPLRYADGCLQRLSSNYILFGGETARVATPELAAELQGGVNYAAQFSYPREWGMNPKHRIADEGFTGYAAHYAQHPEDLPVISWGKGQYPGQLATIRDHDSGTYTPEARVFVGYIGRSGYLEDAQKSPVVATLEDIEQAEAAALDPQQVAQVADQMQRPYKYQVYGMRTREYLAWFGRPYFHRALGATMASRLVTAMGNEFGA
jgi:hypothetical protein